MVKTPRTRHSKSSRKPVTIDHEPEKPVKQDAATKDSPSDVSDESGSATPEGSTDASQPIAEDPSADAVASKPEKVDSGRTSITGLVAAGLIGGVLVLGGGAAMGWVGPWSDKGASTSQLSALQGELADLRAQLQAGIDAAGRDAEEATKSAISAALSDVGGRLTANAEHVASLREEIDGLRSTLEGGGAGDEVAVQALRDRLDELENKVAAIDTAPPASGGTPENLIALEKRITDLEGKVAAAGDVAAKALQSSESGATAISALESKVDALAERIDQQAANPEVAIAIAAAALKSAIDRGLPFMSELETYAAVAPGAPEIEALRDLAASGVPTRADIIAEMGAAADRMIAALNVSDPDAGFFQRLLSSAQSLIKVRPIGMVEGDTPAAIIARMEVAVNGNDYVRALTEFGGLPEAAKSAGEGFASKIEARMKADDLVDKALAAALKPS